jgi:four helix bundle protein
MKKDLEPRTTMFALSVISAVSNFPKNMVAEILGRQLLRSGTSIGANYREANRAVSRADFANKIGTIQKEASETQYWLELLIDSDIVKSQKLGSLQSEATELLAIFTATGRKLKQ